jgi:hypothetical protein
MLWFSIHGLLPIWDAQLCASRVEQNFVRSLCCGCLSIVSFLLGMRNYVLQVQNKSWSKAMMGLPIWSHAY